MILFFTIYILGSIASLYFVYHSMEKGEEMNLLEVAFFIVISLFSWLTFLIEILVEYGDKVVFKKK